MPRSVSPRACAGIPDRHGEFFLAALPEAVELYKGRVPEERLNAWRERLRVPQDQIVRGGLNNWRTYAMKGEWLRSRLGWVERDAAIGFIENAWLRGEQRGRMNNAWGLYEDHTTDPEPHAVEAVGRGNLLALIEAGYDGPAADEMRKLVERGAGVSLCLQDPSGQCPPGGRTDDHVFNDVLYQLIFEVMAERRPPQRRHASGRASIGGPRS